jgi:hypothetical protein
LFLIHSKILIYYVGFSSNHLTSYFKWSGGQTVLEKGPFTGIFGQNKAKPLKKWLFPPFFLTLPPPKQAGLVSPCDG